MTDTPTQPAEMVEPLIPKDMVGRVARAMFFASSGNDEIHEDDGTDIWQAIGTKQEYWIDLARVALGALREPTEAMLKAGTDVSDDYTRPHPDNTLGMWRAAIDAALAPPHEPEEPFPGSPIR